jgi:hypothetical protein
LSARSAAQGSPAATRSKTRPEGEPRPFEGPSC